MPVEENVKARKKVRFFRRAVLLLLVLSIAGIILANLNFFNEDNFKRMLAKLDFSMSGKVSDNSVIEYNSEKSSKFTLFKGGLVLLNNDRLKVFDSTGAEFTNIQITNQSPALNTNDKFIMIFDRDGYDVRLYNSFAEVFHKKFSGKIINASINKTGYFTVISKSEGYKAAVTVFNSSFQEIYKWSSAENYITSANLSPDGSKMAMGTLKTVNGETVAAVDFFSLSKDKPIATKVMKGSFIYSLTYKNNDTICVLTDTECTYFKPDGKEIASKTFDSGNPTAYNNSTDFYTVLAFAESSLNKSTKLVVLDNNGKEVVNSVLEGRVKSLSVQDSYTAALTDDKAYIVNMNGKISKEIKTGRNINYIFAVDYNHILLAGANSAHYEKL